MRVARSSPCFSSASFFLFSCSLWSYQSLRETANWTQLGFTRRMTLKFSDTPQESLKQPYTLDSHQTPASNAHGLNPIFLLNYVLITICRDAHKHTAPPFPQGWTQVIIPPDQLLLEQHVCACCSAYIRRCVCVWCDHHAQARFSLHHFLLLQWCMWLCLSTDKRVSFCCNIGGCVSEQLYISV